jgi:transcriptional regulator with XRE-family HTH domain
MTGRKPFATLASRMGSAQRARAEEKAQRLLAEMPLADLRAALELSQEHLAEILKVDQPAISRMERRTDMLISTLARFVEAMGGTLEMRAEFPQGSVRITRLADIRREAQKPRGAARPRTRASA